MDSGLVWGLLTALMLGFALAIWRVLMDWDDG